LLAAHFEQLAEVRVIRISEASLDGSRLCKGRHDDALALRSARIPDQARVVDRPRHGGDMRRRSGALATLPRSALSIQLPNAVAGINDMKHAARIEAHHGGGERTLPLRASTSTSCPIRSPSSAESTARRPDR